MKTIATINFKGGVGKTTVTWCLGDILSTFGNSNVLLFDLDAQMSLTQAIALDADGASSGKFDKWYEKSINNKRNIFSVLRRYLEDDLTKFHPDNGFVYRLNKNYHFVPSTEQLYWLELETPDPGKGKFFVKNLLGRIQNSGSLPEYDYVLFDCPPSFTILSYSVLTCCDLILIPFNPDFFAAKGVGLLIAGLRHRIQPIRCPLWEYSLIEYEHTANNLRKRRKPGLTMLRRHVNRPVIKITLMSALWIPGFLIVLLYVMQ